MKQDRGMVLRDIVHSYCNVHLWYGPKGKDGPDVNPNSNLAKYLNLANCIVGIFHHSNWMVLCTQELNQHTLIPRDQGDATFLGYLPALQKIDIPELNWHKEHFANTLELDVGLYLVQLIMDKVINQEVEEPNLDQLP